MQELEKVIIGLKRLVSKNWLCLTDMEKRNGLQKKDEES